MPKNFVSVPVPVADNRFGLVWFGGLFLKRESRAPTKGSYYRYHLWLKDRSYQSSYDSLPLPVPPLSISSSIITQPEL